MNIAGKRVLITGGSSGIGLALAHTLLAKGAAVAVSGRRTKMVADAVAVLRADDREVHGIVADIVTPEGRASTLEEALKKLGGLDILVNNAEGVRAGRLENTPEFELQAMVDVNLVAPIMLTGGRCRSCGRAAMP